MSNNSWQSKLILRLSQLQNCTAVAGLFDLFNFNRVIKGLCKPFQYHRSISILIGF